MTTHALVQPTARTAVLPSVRLSGVHKSFGQVHAVRGIELTVNPGEVVAFLGPNGAGKTTTIDMMLGLSRPSSGTVEVYGMPPAEAVARGLVAAVMQTGGLLREITVEETGLTWGAVLNLAVWTAVFVTGAAWRFRRDTARV